MFGELPSKMKIQAFSSIVYLMKEHTRCSEEERHVWTISSMLRQCEMTVEAVSTPHFWTLCKSAPHIKTFGTAWHLHCGISNWLECTMKMHFCRQQKSSGIFTYLQWNPYPKTGHESILTALRNLSSGFRSSLARSSIASDYSYSLVQRQKNSPGEAPAFLYPFY